MSNNADIIRDQITVWWYRLNEAKEKVSYYQSNDWPRPGPDDMEAVYIWEDWQECYQRAKDSLDLAKGELAMWQALTY